MQFGVDSEGNRVHISKASADVSYHCMFCGAPLILKRGDIRAHHYAHVHGTTCSDDWTPSYELSTWHQDWQNRYPEQNQEIKLTLGNISHRADVMVGKTIVEFQHSAMSSKTFNERNQYYINFGNKIVWLFDFRDRYVSGGITEDPANKLRFILHNTRGLFKLTDVYRPDIEIFFQLKDTEESIVRAAQVNLSVGGSFISDKWYTAEDFIRFTSSGSDTILPPESLLEYSEEYRAFKEKHKIDLTQQQERAVQTVYGPVLIIAVPGSGKTTVLVDRIGYMCEVKGVSPYKILAITFTKSAASEMKKRVSNKYGKTVADSVTFRTINSLAQDIITRYCSKDNRKRPVLIDEKEKKRIIRELLKAEDSERYIYEKDVTEVTTAISYYKNRELDPKERDEFTVQGIKVKHIVDGLSEKMQQYSKTGEWIIDYDDQLVYASRILKTRQDILREYQEKYQYICLDEAQDTTRIQFDIVNRIASAHNNIFMVGDDDQSIYGFRGAFPEELYSFRDNYLNPAILYLETNFRSNVEITSAADSFIANSRTYPKRIYSNRGKGGALIIQDVDSRTKQFEDVMSNIADRNGSVGILYRDNLSVIPLLQRFEEKGIQYRILGENKFFFESKSVVNFLIFLKMVIDPHDASFFKNNIKRIFYDIEDKKREKWIPKEMRESGKTISEALRSQYEKYAANSPARRKAYTLANLIEKCPFSPVKAIEYYDSEARMQEFDYLTKDNLLSLAKNVETLQDYIAIVDGMAELAGTKHTRQSDVTLSTIHSAKGLEFDHVMIIDVVDGIFPSQGAIESDDLKKEEKRLMYVGLTRAKNKLTVYNIKGMASSFVKELDTRQPYIDVDVQVQRAINKIINQTNKNTSETKYNHVRPIVDRSTRPTIPPQVSTASIANRIPSDRKEKPIVTDEVRTLVEDEENMAKINGVRWVKCKICGEIKPDYEFTSYGGKDSINRGECRACYRKKYH